MRTLDLDALHIFRTVAEQGGITRAAAKLNRVLLAYADELLRLSSEAQAAVKSGTPRGTFRIGTLESTAAARLPPLLSRYHLAYPEVQIELVTGTSGNLVSRLLAFEIEAAKASCRAR